MNRWSNIVLVVLLASGEARSDEPKATDRLSDVRFLVGRWNGTSDGQAGRGSVSRVYEPVLNGATSTSATDPNTLLSRRTPRERSTSIGAS